MTPVETLAAAINHLEVVGPYNDQTRAQIAILSRALELAERGHKNTLSLELDLAEAIIA